MTVSMLILSFLYILFLSVTFFRQKHIISKETKIFSMLLTINIVGLIVEILLKYLCSTIGGTAPITGFFTRFYFIYIMLFSLLLSYYVFYLARGNGNDESFVKNKFTLTVFIFSIIYAIVVCFLPIDYVSKYSDYCTGMAVNAIYLYCACLITGSFYLVFTTKGLLRNKKFLPMLIFIFGNVGGALIQRYNPSITITTIMQSFVLFVMYHTIENPDVKMIEQLEIAKEQADKANNAKSDFLSNMSHEIRTPLNAIVGFSETLKDENIPESARENVDDIIMASNNLLDIVNGILDISKIEANKLEIINKEYDIKSVLDELTALTKARIGDKGLDFRVNIDPALPRVLYGDNIRIKQVILNILTNAVKYTKEGYVIFTVSSVIKDDVCRLIISVEDSGIGIREESIPKLFSKFERLDVEKEITIEGTGLGLAITKKLVELMNGTIVVQSVYGKGSKFTISIDQRIIAVEPPPVHEAPAAASTVIDARGAHALIVDDNELNLKVASVLLSKYHFEIDTSSNGQDCLNKIRKGNTYDIIFMDDMMPKMNGKEALAKLKEMPEFKTPVIALTANAITGMRQEYLNLGFNDYLSKPIEKPELERIIKEFISKATSIHTNTELSRKSNSLLDKQFTIDLPVLAVNGNETNEIKDFSGKKVLVVDDNEMNLKIAVNALKKYNFEIDSVTSGRDAIVKVIENKYDLIFLDDMMPEIDGCKTIDNFRDTEDFTTPTIMMTASSRDEVEGKLKEHKFDGYLAKPFKKEELEKVINDLLK